MSVFDTQYVIVVTGTGPEGTVTWVEGSKHGGTIWTGLRGQGGATAVARRAAEAIEDDLVDEGWTDVAVHVLPVNANPDVEAGFPRPVAKEELRRTLPSEVFDPERQRRIAGEGRRMFIERERALLPTPRELERVDL